MSDGAVKSTIARLREERDRARRQRDEAEERVKRLEDGLRETVSLACSFIESSKLRSNLVQFVNATLGPQVTRYEGDGK